MPVITIESMVTRARPSYTRDFLTPGTFTLNQDRDVSHPLKWLMIQCWLQWTNMSRSHFYIDWSAERSIKPIVPIRYIETIKIAFICSKQKPLHSPLRLQEEPVIKWKVWVSSLWSVTKFFALSMPSCPYFFHTGASHIMCPFTMGIQLYQQLLNSPRHLIFWRLLPLYIFVQSTMSYHLLYIIIIRFQCD